MNTRRAWLCVPPILLALLDCVATSYGQPDQYWRGDTGVAQEDNPIVRWFMLLHPSAFFMLTVVWIAAFCFGILKLPRVLALMLALSVMVSHACCACTWLFPHNDGFYWSLALCIGSAILFVLALELSREDAG